MPPEKRNHFLDIDESDDDGSQGYNSDVEQLRKGASKRRKLNQDDGTDEEEPLSAGEDSQGDGDDGDQEDELVEGLAEEGEQSTNPDKPSSKDSSDLLKTPRQLMKKNLVATEKEVKKSGVIYISRIPPFMKPGTVRSIFERFGKINRVYLSPEDTQVRARRLKQGQNRKKNFNEGWLEFIRKSDAKTAVALLNGTTLAAIGMAKKRGYYRDDIWSLRYLNGFKWHNLTEQIASETAERQSRIHAEIGKATRENKEFVRNIQKSKELEGIQSKAAAKKITDTEEAGPAAVTNSKPDVRSLRKFKQASTGKKEPAKASESATRVLRQLF
ncbi:putative pre-rRNA-processing protein ESF2 [Rosellinia necatrix]|uniref:18S rRNA factor 2 n=1 Tax=Rosellinia necatrix TaxID=77044 RepID=A0A1W2TXJ8_ROSNE|nr:putative pre-rRNA-processing protein ESF2 [Rosellinia necatrix]